MPVWHLTPYLFAREAFGNTEGAQYFHDVDPRANHNDYR